MSDPHLPSLSNVRPGVRITERRGTVSGTIASEVNEHGNVLVEWDDGLRWWSQARLVAENIAEARASSTTRQEVLRLCTQGERNAPSMLYATCWRAARALGYRKLVTYTLKTEPGTSLRAAGWRIVGEVTKRSWDTPSRPRVDKDERQERFRWEVAA